MSFLSPLQWLVILAVVLLLFGGRGKISAIMGDFGKGLRNFKTGLKGDEGEAEADADAEEEVEAIESAPAKKAAPKKKAAAKKAGKKTAKKAAAKKAATKKAAKK
jgi:sec-independent protein translocase protein TatA